MKNKKPEILIIDVDGTMTNGHHIFCKRKTIKIFGPDDNDALNLMRKFMKINIYFS